MAMQAALMRLLARLRHLSSLEASSFASIGLAGWNQAIERSSGLSRRALSRRHGRALGCESGQAGSLAPAGLKWIRVFTVFNTPGK